MKKAVYLDHNATTPVDRTVLEAMLPFLQDHYGNPSSVYRRGRLARQAVESAREQVAQLVNVSPSQVVFTGGGTEANSMAINGVVSAGDCIAVCETEHASVLEPASRLAKTGMCDLHVIKVDRNGYVDEASFDRALSKQPKLVSVMSANNETGVVQGIQYLAGRAMGSGAVFHTDAVQAIGKMPVDFNETGAQLMSLSAHKIYGPKGVGALILDSQVELSPLIVGGGHERGYRSGTCDVGE